MPPAIGGTSSKAEGIRLRGGSAGGYFYCSVCFAAAIVRVAIAFRGVVRAVVAVFGRKCFRLEGVGGSIVFVFLGSAFLVLLQKFEQKAEYKKENAARQASPEGDHSPVNCYDHARHRARRRDYRADHPQNLKHVFPRSPAAHACGPVFVSWEQYSIKGAVLATNRKGRQKILSQSEGGKGKVMPYLAVRDRKKYKIWRFGKIRQKSRKKFKKLQKNS